MMEREELGTNHIAGRTKKMARIKRRGAVTWTLVACRPFGKPIRRPTNRFESAKGKEEDEYNGGDLRNEETYSLLYDH